MRRSPLLPVALAFASVACSQTPGPMPLYAPDSGVLIDAPWPTDDRLVGGTLDLSGYPDGGIGLLQNYVALGETLEGWGPTAPVYFPFDKLPAVEALPTPEQSLSVEGGVFLVDVDPDSPHRGTLVPIQWERVPLGTLVPDPVLAIAPVFGFPLRPSTTYAAVVTTAVAARHPDFAARLGEPGFAELVEVTAELGLSEGDLAVGTVFTTRDPIGELGTMVDAARAMAPMDLSQTVTQIDSTAFSLVFEGATQAPLWQHGDKPYATTGGEFRFDDRGAPIMAAWEPLRLSLCTPRDLTAAPAAGFPIVVYAHGTGGSYLSASEGGAAASYANVGVVTLSFDQPLHGPRGTSGTDTDRHSFNYFNPTAARANFRQGALDLLWLVQALRTHDTTFTTDDGTPIPIDTRRIVFVGHSHGGLTGSIAGPWLGDDVQGAVFSGAGGGLAITIVKRKDPLDIAQLIKGLLDFGAEEQLTSLHPVVGTVQLLVEETDPMNYAPYWLAEDGGFSSRPLPTLLTSGQHDAQTDHETAEALAAAARLPRIEPAWNEPISHVLRGLDLQRSPAQGNVTGFDGDPVTAGLSEWEDGDHFVIFRDARATRMVQRFVETAAAGDAMIKP